MTDHASPNAPDGPVTQIPTAPVTPRAAASLLVLRETGAGPEVLMGLRGAGHRFMPNRLVFPGGGVDPADHDAAFATPMPAHVRRRLAIGADAAIADALGVAAARELHEETGLSLGSPPALDGLDYLCRAITPPASPVRFDARFLVVDAARLSGVLAGSGELEGLRYYRIADAMALDLAFVTHEVCGKLLEWLAMTPDARAARTGVATLRHRVWAWEEAA